MRPSLWLPLPLMLALLAGCSSEEPLVPEAPATEELPAQATGDAGTCILPGGRALPQGALFADAISCNVCLCVGEGVLRCTMAGCTSGDRLRPCSADADCGSGDTCLFDPGCGAQARGYCVAVSCGGISGQEPQQCGCDGVTRTVACPTQPYAHPGACAPQG